MTREPPCGAAVGASKTRTSKSHASTAKFAPSALDQQMQRGTKNNDHPKAQENLNKTFKIAPEQRSLTMTKNILMYVFDQKTMLHKFIKFNGLENKSFEIYVSLLMIDLMRTRPPLERQSHIRRGCTRL
jgi:hypothetical protein